MFGLWLCPLCVAVFCMSSYFHVCMFNRCNIITAFNVKYPLLSAEQVEVSRAAGDHVRLGGKAKDGHRQPIAESCHVNVIFLFFHLQNVAHAKPTDIFIFSLEN